MNKKQVALVVIIVLLSIVLVIGSTYAFFLAGITGNEDATPIKITAGEFELTFVDTQGIYFDSGVRPGTSADKTFTVQNTGTADDTYTYNYNIKLTDLTVTYEKEDLEYTLQEYTSDTYETPKGEPKTGYINKDTVNEDGEMYLAIGIERPPKGELHYYKLTIEFKSLEGVNQNYNQGKTFGGKINVDDNRNAKLYVKPSSGSSASDIIIADSTTIFDNDADNNLRYVGQDPSNYIWFNCDDYDFTSAEEAASKNCEKWRIIGLFKNITKTEGGQEDLVKIIRDKSAGKIAWDSARTNNWTNASLKPLLEGYYNGTALSSAAGIKASTKDMIEQVTWNLGGPTSYDITAAQYYTAERGTTVPSGAPQTYDGYIGLMYPSDYGYATAGGSNVDRAACLAYSLYNWNSGNYKTDCASNSWLYDSSNYQWTFTPYSSRSNLVFSVLDTGYVYYSTAYYTDRAVRPSLYLKSSVLIANGEGTSTEPYVLQPGE